MTGEAPAEALQDRASKAIANVEVLARFHVATDVSPDLYTHPMGALGHRRRSSGNKNWFPRCGAQIKKPRSEIVAIRIG